MYVLYHYIFFNGGSHASDVLHVLVGVSVAYKSCLIMRNVTHIYLPNKFSSSSSCDRRHRGVFVQPLPL